MCALNSCEKSKWCTSDDGITTPGGSSMSVGIATWLSSSLCNGEIGYISHNDAHLVSLCTKQTMSTHQGLGYLLHPMLHNNVYTIPFAILILAEFENVLPSSVCLFVCFLAALSEDCDSSDCRMPPDWHDVIFCKSVFNTKKRFLHVHCSWSPYLSSSSSKSTEYKLHLWSDSDCEAIATNGPDYTIRKNKLAVTEKTTIWVSHHNVSGHCVKTNNFSIVPQVNCEPPNIQYAVHASNSLSFKLSDNGQVRYRENVSTQWHIINVTSMWTTISLPETSMPTSYVVQQRCSRESCFHCIWKGETKIPHKLTGAPDIFVTTKKLSPGKQRVTVEWKYIKHDYVDGYFATIQRLPNSCDYSISFNTTNTTLQIDLSVAFFNVSIRAYNRAGSSELTSAVVHPLDMPELPGKIFATYENDTIFLTWSPLFSCNFVVINWGTSFFQMKSRTLMHKIDNYSIPGPFERMKRYMIMIYLYDSCQCQYSTNETTFGITSIYSEEGVPRTGPSDISVRNVTKTAAAIEWGEIPEEDCLGFLLGYRIYCTSTSRNTTLEMFLNSTNQRRYLLEGLTSDHAYEVTVAGVTSKGAGTPSASRMFKTLKYAEVEFQSIIMSICGGIFISAILISVLVYTIHRKKKNVYFPKIPNPKHSQVIKMNKEAPSKIKLIQSSQFPETNCDRYGVEVIEQIPIVSIPTESCIQRRETCTMKKQTHPQVSPAQAPNVQDYTSMMSMINVFKRMPQSTNHVN
ncbi:interleukin-31 receptor subunit alpha-like [Mixophyes fleayi]|uniref:interleukin-31 receptor subunit alpha-like n=1 Tax=Mixophyes fleayi TaxID=3061075 RepID=UPI003F4D9EA2